jgi:protein-S-isoprenylcysteine O-methyltransferase Ste14
VRVFTAWNLAVFATWVVLPFVLAGSIAWVPGWLHLAAVGAGALSESLYVAWRNPGLRERRKRIGAGTKAWDLVWNAAFWPLMASIAVVGGLQHGALGPSMPAGSWALGLPLLAAGFALSAWAMATNPWFEATARIQAEIGHRVFEGGPYRHVRHPGYLGLALWALGTPFLLRSTWSIGPAFAVAAWIVLRTALEDAMLRRELQGYAEYAGRTRFRLMPGLW